MDEARYGQIIRDGERNKEVAELIHNWCSHARVSNQGGVGLIAQQTGLPIGHFAMECDFAQPAADLRAVDVVVVDPALVAGVVRRVDVDALHLAGVARQQGLERVQVVALHDQVAAVAAVVVAAAELWHRLQQAERHVLVVLDDGFLADPVQCGHSACPIHLDAMAPGHRGVVLCERLPGRAGQASVAILPAGAGLVGFCCPCRQRKACTVV